MRNCDSEQAGSEPSHSHLTYQRGVVMVQPEMGVPLKLVQARQCPVLSMRSDPPRNLTL